MYMNIFLSEPLRFYAVHTESLRCWREMCRRVTNSYGAATVREDAAQRDAVVAPEVLAYTSLRRTIRAFSTTTPADVISLMYSNILLRCLLHGKRSRWLMRVARVPRDARAPNGTRFRVRRRAWGERGHQWFSAGVSRNVRGNGTG